MKRQEVLEQHAENLPSHVTNESLAHTSSHNKVRIIDKSYLEKNYHAGLSR